MARPTPKLTQQSRLVLAALYKTDRPMYGYELSTALRVPVNAVHGNLHRLESLGFLRHADEPTSARRQEQGTPRVWFELTDDGRQLAEEILPETERIVRAQAETLGLEIGF